MRSYCSGAGARARSNFIGGARTGAPLLFLVRSAERERAPKSKERLMLCGYYTFSWFREWYGDDYIREQDKLLDLSCSQLMYSLCVLSMVTTGKSLLEDSTRD